MRRWLENRFLLSAGAGLCLALAFPQPGVAGLAWIAPGLLLFSALGARPGEQFRAAYVGGLVYALVSLRWLLYIPFPLGAVAGWLALASYVGLYPAVWVCLCWRLFPGLAVIGSADLKSSAAVVLDVPWSARLCWTCVCGAAWVAGEMVIGRFLTGFPWNFLGVSQHPITPLIQVASVAGVYGLSFLLVWFSVALGCTGASLIRNPLRKIIWMRELAVPALVVAVAAGWGLGRVTASTAGQETVRVALVQPSIPQVLIWDTNQIPRRFAQLLELSGGALRSQPKPQLVIWPEAALPPLTEEMYESIVGFVREHEVWMIFGSDDMDERLDEDGKRTALFFNAGFLLNPQGRLAGRYHKRHLVIFGEYIPLEDWLPFLKNFTPIEGSLSPGEKAVPLRLANLSAEASLLICFEDTFPHLVRESVREETDFLVNLTNNGWFGESSAQWQHAVNALFRAVETGVPLVRCGNNGLSCWVDPVGRMRAVYFPDSADIYQAGYKTFDVPLHSMARGRQPTWYLEHGDVFGWSCVALVTVMLCAQTWKMRARQRKIVP